MAELKYWNPFLVALQQHCGCQLIEAQERTGQLRLQLRVPAEKNDAWLTTMRGVVRAAVLPKVSVDLSRQFILQPTGEWRWAWRLILQHAELEGVLHQLLLGLPIQKGLATVDKEIPLHASPNRHATVVPVR